MVEDAHQQQIYVTNFGNFPPNVLPSVNGQSTSRSILFATRESYEVNIFKNYGTKAKELCMIGLLILINDNNY